MAWFKCPGNNGGGGGGGIEYLFEAQDLIPNTYINTAGQPVTYNGWSATDFIEVTPNEVLTCAVSDRQNYNSWYDENQTYISNFGFSTLGYLTIQVPSNARYVRFSNYTQNMENSIRIWRAT